MDDEEFWKEKEWERKIIKKHSLDGRAVKRNCPRCKGTGKIICDWCDGEGKRYYDYEKTEFRDRCPECNGSGKKNVMNVLGTDGFGVALGVMHMVDSYIILFRKSNSKKIIILLAKEKGGEIR